MMHLHCPARLPKTVLDMCYECEFLVMAGGMTKQLIYYNDPVYPAPALAFHSKYAHNSDDSHL